MSTVAFGLRADFAGTTEQVHVDPSSGERTTETVPVFTGGLLNVDDDRDLDVRAELDADPHPGVIVVPEADTALVLTLDGYPALKRVTVPEGATPILSGYTDLNVKQLRGEARRRGLQGFTKAGKDALVAALTEHDARLSDGDTDANAAPDHVVNVEPEGDLETPADRAGEPGVNADTADRPEA